MTDKELLDRLHEELGNDQLAEKHLVTLERLMNQDGTVPFHDAAFAVAWALLQMVEG